MEGRMCELRALAGIGGRRFRRLPGSFAKIFRFKRARRDLPAAARRSRDDGSTVARRNRQCPCRRHDPHRVVQHPGLRRKKLAKPRVGGLLAEIIRRFDIVAIQEVRSKQDILPQFVDAINATGRHYDYRDRSAPGPHDSKEQYAFVFDPASIEVDRTALYTVADPDDLLHREPLVGWFRVRGPPPDAGLYVLADRHPHRSRRDEAGAGRAGRRVRAVRDDGRDEDDVILLGDLNVDDQHLGRLGQMSNIHWADLGVASNTRGNEAVRQHHLFRHGHHRIHWPLRACST